MQSNKHRKNKNADWIRTYAPYIATAALVIVLFWGVDSIKQDGQQKQWQQPLEVVKPPRDWTHKLSTAAPYDDKNRQDDHTHNSCPLPTGNWAHTCDREITVEGPCSGKCLLKARCQDVKEKFKETTFEYNEGRRLEIKNVNGLLCSIEDGSPSCGVNFHGNLALKNCGTQGYIPRRHEFLPDGLYAPAADDKDKDQDKNDYDKDPDDDRYDYEKDNDEYEDYGPKYNKKRSRRSEEDDYTERRSTRRNRRDDDEYPRRRDEDDDEEPPYKPRTNRRRDEDTDDWPAQPPAPPPRPRKRSFDDYDTNRGTTFKSRRSYDEEPDRRRSYYDADDRRKSRFRQNFDEDDVPEDDDDRMLRGPKDDARPKRRRPRYDDDDDRPQRRLSSVDGEDREEW
jgi:hypothetical protein